MTLKKIIPCIYLQNGKAVTGFADPNPTGDGDAVAAAKYYSDNGADELLVFDFSNTDEEHESAIGLLKEIGRAVDIPVMVGGNIKRTEDVKKLLYAGASKVILNYSKQSNIDLTIEVSKRFGKEKILAGVNNYRIVEMELDTIQEYTYGVVFINAAEIYDIEKTAAILEQPIIPILEQSAEADLCSILAIEGVEGVSADQLNNEATNFFELKKQCRQAGIPVHIFESKMEWKELKLNSDNMVPVVVQDYKTDEVLMLAYMNQEAFEQTIATGKMTYYSRSRNELWIKGLSSGHFQYVKSLTADCDKDTILAKVSQVGGACHTGKHSCFFNEIIKKDYVSSNPLKVFEDVYDIIAERKENPKEGSYTNYLFDKGIDKILKKIGEEATEIVIAAKNPDSEEIKYEMSDFLYHAMVLMVEKGVTWEDITKELANR